MGEVHYSIVTCRVKIKYADQNQQRYETNRLNDPGTDVKSGPPHPDPINQTNQQQKQPSDGCLT
jgi:hypothetical protein